MAPPHSTVAESTAANSAGSIAATGTVIDAGFAPPTSDLFKYIALLIGATVIITVFISWLANATSNGVAGAAIDVPGNTITVALADEPPQLDSTRATDQISHMILGHVMEGLLRYDAQNKLVPGVAERWEIRPDGATFHLRNSARWSDGKPVTAADFVFAWRKVVDPKTASEYAFIMYSVKNAKAINTGKLSIEKLGVRAVDASTLEVAFERPLAFFDKLVAFSVYFPVRQDFYEAQQGRYGANAENMLFNGPFTLTRWVHGAQLRIERNPLYWNQHLAKLNAVNFGYITSDGNAWLNLFRDGKIAWAGLDSENLKTAMEQRWHIRREITGSTYYIEFNERPDRPTRNVHLRRAMLLVFDPGELVNKVIKIPGNLAAYSLFPNWIRGEQGSFLDEYPPPWHDRVDIAAAKRELEIARAELGTIPPLVLLNSESSIADKQAEYFQSLFKETLGLELRIDKQTFKQRLAKMTAGQFDLVAAGWGPDYDDGLTFGDLFASWNLNNRGRYNNPELDRQVHIAESSLDQHERLAAFAAIQKIEYDEAVIIPNYQQGKVFVEDPRLRGVVKRAVGPSPDYTNAYIADKTL